MGKHFGEIDDKNNDKREITEVEEKRVKEKKKTNWYLKLQKPMRIIGILVTAYCTLKLPSIKPMNRFLDFDMLEPVGIDMIHGRIFSSYVSEVVSVLSHGVTVALAAALVSLILAGIWEMFDNDTWYKYQNIGLCICGFTGLYYPIVSLLLGGGTITSNGIITTYYVVLVIIAVAVAVYNIVKFRDKKDVYASEKKLLKKGPMVLILVACIAAFVYPVVNLADDYIEVNEIRQLIDNHPEDYREEIEAHMGNYAMGTYSFTTACSYNGEIYIVEGDIEGEEPYGVYRIDKDGNYELVWQLDEPGVVCSIKRLVLYDGYLYVKIGCYDETEQKQFEKIKRIALTDKREETIVSSEARIDFGIYDNQLMYYEILRLEDTGYLDDYATVYTINLAEDLDKKTLYDKGLNKDYFGANSWLNIMLYNKHDNYYRYPHQIPQSYENSTYYISDRRELIMNAYSEDSNIGTEDFDYYSYVLDSYVYSFNLYKGKIYYVKSAGGELYSDCQLWSCDVDGGSRKLIGAFPSDSGVENEVEFRCDSLYVTDEYVVCDFYRGKNGIDERYLMQIDGGLYKKID